MIVSSTRLLMKSVFSCSDASFRRSFLFTSFSTSHLHISYRIITISPLRKLKCIMLQKRVKYYKSSSSTFFYFRQTPTEMNELTSRIVTQNSHYLAFANNPYLQYSLDPGTRSNCLHLSNGNTRPWRVIQLRTQVHSIMSQREYKRSKRLKSVQSWHSSSWTKEISET